MHTFTCRNDWTKAGTSRANKPKVNRKNKWTTSWFYIKFRCMPRTFLAYVFLAAFCRWRRRTRRLFILDDRQPCAFKDDIHIQPIVYNGISFQQFYSLCSVVFVRQCVCVCRPYKSHFPKSKFSFSFALSTLVARPSFASLFVYLFCSLAVCADRFCAGVHKIWFGGLANGKRQINQS